MQLPYSRNERTDLGGETSWSSVSYLSYWPPRHIDSNLQLPVWKFRANSPNSSSYTLLLYWYHTRRICRGGIRSQWGKSGDKRRSRARCTLVRWRWHAQWCLISTNGRERGYPARVRQSVHSDRRLQFVQDFILTHDTDLTQHCDPS